MSWRREGSLFSTLNSGIKARNSTETKLPRSIFDHELSKLFFSFSLGYLWKFLSFIFPQSYQRLCDLPFRSTSLSSSVKITSIYANTRSHTISKWLKQVDYEENMRGARTRIKARFDLLKITFIAFYFVFSKNSFPSKAPFYLFFFFFTRKVKIVIFDIFIEEGWLNPFSIAKW